GLRSLQRGDALTELLSGLAAARSALQVQYARHVPMAIKIAPDMEMQDVDRMADALIRAGMDGVIATNTTLSREGVGADPLAEESGGLSGGPLTARSTAVVRRLAQQTGGRLAIIGVGGILDG